MIWYNDVVPVFVVIQTEKNISNAFFDGARVSISRYAHGLTVRE